MLDERQEQDAALFALDLLEERERAVFEAELAREPALQRLVDELRAASAQLAHTVDAPPPSAALRDRILASIDAVPLSLSRPVSAMPQAVPALSAAGTAGSGRWLRFPWFAPGLAAAAAAFAVGAFVYGFRYHATSESLAAAREELVATRRQLDVLQDQKAALVARQAAEARQSDARLAALQGELQQFGSLDRVSLTRLARTAAIHPDAQALALWDPRLRRGLLTLENLPALGPDEDYQLWVIIPGEPAPISLGVFLVEPTGLSRIPFGLDRPLDPASKLAISREPKGGSPAPRGPVIALGPI